MSLRRSWSPRLLDAALVTGLLLLRITPSPTAVTPTSVAFHVALVVPLLWRRGRPMTVFAAIAAVAFTQWCFDERSLGDAALLFAMYSVALSQPLPRTLAAFAVLETGVVLAVLRWGEGADLPSFIGLTGLATAAAVMGVNGRQRLALLASLRDRADQLEAERDQQGRLAAAAERSRIAREMHDIVAHNLSVMVALADGARYALHESPQRAEAALTTAGRTGRQALTEMRRLLGVLREEPGAQLAPQPGIAALEALVEQVREAGVPVLLETLGESGQDPPPGVQLAVFRIVQEALTNTLKHAGPGVRCSVRLTRCDDQVRVEVTDTGGPLATLGIEGGGLQGMRERAAVYGGALEAGPRPGGGWRVAVTLSFAEAPATVGVA